MTDSDAAVVDAGTQSDAATYTRVREHAFNSCSGEGCHYGLQPSLNLWDWKSLVNAQSAGAPGKVRVKPFDPDNSFLFQKITNKQGKNEGTVMPPYGMLLGDQIELVRRWIAAGAKND